MKKNPMELRKEADVLRLLGILTAAGIPLIRGLPIAAESLPEWKEPLTALHATLKKGDNMLSDTMARRPEQFTPFISKLVYEGETSGCVEVAFLEGSRLLETIASLTQAGHSEDEIGEFAFFRLLGLQIDWGAPISKSLEAAGMAGLSKKAYDGIFQKVMREGETFCAGFEVSPGRFDRGTYAFINYAECTGTMPAMCLEVAEMKRQKLLMASSKNVMRLAPDQLVWDDIADYRFLSLLVEGRDISGKSLQSYSRHVLANPAWKAVGHKMESGSSFSEAMESTGAFPMYMVELVKIGEKEDDLSHAFDTILGYLKWIYLGEDVVVRAPVPA